MIYIDPRRRRHLRRSPRSIITFTTVQVCYCANRRADEVSLSILFILHVDCACWEGESDGTCHCTGMWSLIPVGVASLIAPYVRLILIFICLLLAFLFSELGVSSTNKFWHAIIDSKLHCRQLVSLSLCLPPRCRPHFLHLRHLPCCTTQLRLPTPVILIYLPPINPLHHSCPRQQRHTCHLLLYLLLPARPRWVSWDKHILVPSLRLQPLHRSLRLQALQQIHLKVSN